MHVVMITGDRKFTTPGTEAYKRMQLQRSAVEELTVVYWGRGSIWPNIPLGHVDVVTVQDPFWRGLVGWFLARRRRAKFNVQVHTDMLAATGSNLLRHILSQIVLRHADSIRVVSEKIKSQVEQIGVHAPIVVLPVFINRAAFHGTDRRSSAQKTILWIGRFEEEKNPLKAIVVLKEVLQVGLQARLIMLGDGSLSRKVADCAAGLPVEIPGWKQNVQSYLEVADVVLSTSRHESWGASMVEALAAGVPVVAPDVGIAREAGAFVVEDAALGQKVLEVLRSNIRGILKLPLHTEEEWGGLWRKSLEL